MKFNRKKIIAREFLILLSTVLIILTSYLLLNCRNNNVKAENDNLKVVLSELIDKQERDPITIREKQLENLVENYYKGMKLDTLFSELPDTNSYPKSVLGEYLATEKSGKYETLYEVNKKFPELFSEQDIKKSEAYRFSIDAYKEEIQKLEKTIKSESHIMRLTTQIALFLFAILFGFRYIFYITKWSILALKSKDN